MTKHVISVGGGITSTYRLTAAVIDLYGIDNVEAVCAALKDEHEDMWKLVKGTEKRYGIPVTRIARNLNAGDNEPRYLINPPKSQYPSVWDVFLSEGILGNTLADPCSRMLKREIIADYLLDHYDPADTVIHFGFEEWEVIDRALTVERRYMELGFRCEWPLALPQYQDFRNKAEQCLAYAGFIPEIYTRTRAGHLNCGGACVKATIPQWAELYREDRATYLKWMRNEQYWQQYWMRPNTILKESNGTPISLRELARQIDAGRTFRRPAKKNSSKRQMTLFEGSGCVWCVGA